MVEDPLDFSEFETAGAGSNSDALVDAKFALQMDYNLAVDESLTKEAERFIKEHKLAKTSENYLKVIVYLKSKDVSSNIYKYVPINKPESLKVRRVYRDHAYLGGMNGWRRDRGKLKLITHFKQVVLPAVRASARYLGMSEEWAKQMEQLALSEGGTYTLKDRRTIKKFQELFNAYMKAKGIKIEVPPRDEEVRHVKRLMRAGKLKVCKKGCWISIGDNTEVHYVYDGKSLKIDNVRLSQIKVDGYVGVETLRAAKMLLGNVNPEYEKAPVVVPKKPVKIAPKPKETPKPKVESVKIVYSFKKKMLNYLAELHIRGGGRYLSGPRLLYGVLDALDPLTADRLFKEIYYKDLRLSGFANMVGDFIIDVTHQLKRDPSVFNKEFMKRFDVLAKWYFIMAKGHSRDRVEEALSSVRGYKSKIKEWKKLTGLSNEDFSYFPLVKQQSSFAPELVPASKPKGNKFKADFSSVFLLLDHLSNTVEKMLTGKAREILLREIQEVWERVESYHDRLITQEDLYQLSKSMENVAKIAELIYDGYISPNMYKYGLNLGSGSMGKYFKELFTVSSIVFRDAYNDLKSYYMTWWRKGLSLFKDYGASDLYEEYITKNHGAYYLKVPRSQLARNFLTLYAIATYRGGADFIFKQFVKQPDLSRKIEKGDYVKVYKFLWDYSPLAKELFGQLGYRNPAQFSKMSITQLEDLRLKLRRALQTKTTIEVPLRVVKKQRKKLTN